MDRFDERYCYVSKDGRELLTLTQEEESLLKNFIMNNLQKRKYFNRRHTSYGYKHLLERKLGFYISNADCKKALCECGFNHEPCEGNEINWMFNITEASIQNL